MVEKEVQKLCLNEQKHNILGVLLVSILFPVPEAVPNEFHAKSGFQMVKHATDVPFRQIFGHKMSIAQQIYS